MKRFLSALLVALLLTACASALAETTSYKELGFAIDFSAIQEQSANCPFLQNWGVSSRDPFISSMGIYFVNLPRTVIETISEMEEGSEDAEAYDALEEALTIDIGVIIVTNAKTLAEVSADDSMLAKCEAIEFGTLGDYHGVPVNANDVYESTFEKLLAGEAIVDSPETGSTENESGEYRVFVYDEDGNPVKGVIVQLCDESTCSFQKTRADGMATFQVEAPKVYDVHVGKVPEGYQSSDETYKTLDTYSDMEIFISKAE